MAECVQAADQGASAAQIVLRSDGSVEVEGKDYTDANALRAKLVEMQNQFPGMEFQVLPEPDAQLIDHAPGIKLLQDTGVIRLGFVVSPRGLEVTAPPAR